MTKSYREKLKADKAPKPQPKAKKADKVEAPPADPVD